MVEEKKERYKEKRYSLQISQELKDILDKIRANVEYSTWGVETDLGYFKASKILAIRVKNSKVY